jgi:hypothetical protein
MTNRALIGLHLALPAVITVATLLTAPGAFAQQTSLGDQLAGTTWSLVSVYNEQDGMRTEPFGPKPKGIFVLDRSGNFVQFFLRDGLPKFASGNRAKGTPEENQAVVQGSNAYFGTYTINEKDKLMVFNVVGSTFPNWDGQQQQRLASISGSELTLTNPTAAVGGRGVSVWRRMN